MFLQQVFYGIERRRKVLEVRGTAGGSSQPGSDMPLMPLPCRRFCQRCTTCTGTCCSDPSILG